MIKSRRLRWAGHVARMEEGRNAFKILTGTSAGKKPLGRSRRRWEDNIIIGPKYSPQDPGTIITIRYVF